MNRKLVLLFSIVLFIQACSRAAAPVQQRQIVAEPEPLTTQRNLDDKAQSIPVDSTKGFHVVQKGDTLYSIAWRYSQDYKNVANWNNIKSPYTIYPGQMLRLIEPKSSTQNIVNLEKKKGDSLQAKTTKKLPSKNTQPAKPVATKPATPQPAPNGNMPALPKGPIKWSWPTSGKLAKSNSPTSKKGIDISGKNGQIIKAAAAGDVVYSGSGLFGYGKLIIIKHNDTYLSAYAYNSKLLVKEGDRVRTGQAISHMGQDHAGRTVLHFEIRKDGKPINPIKYLPKRSA
ncbi:MAG: peptidoglycan DD-metalloendopeptidase family protein [Pseudomonadota bacterium]